MPPPSVTHESMESRLGRPSPRTRSSSKESNQPTNPINRLLADIQRPCQRRVTVLLLSNLGTFVIRIRILCIVHVFCMYFECILMCPVHIHQDTSRYIKIHQDTFVSFTLAIIGNVSYLGICILGKGMFFNIFGYAFKKHPSTPVSFFTIHSGYN